MPNSNKNYNSPTNNSSSNNDNSINNGYMTTPPTSNNNNNNKQNNNKNKKRVKPVPKAKMSIRDRLQKEMDKDAHRKQMLNDVKNLLKHNLSVFNKRQLSAFYHAGLITKNKYNQILIQKQINKMKI